MGALLVYALGKTFFWPTMLAVAGDRFPRTGAIAMSLMGGVGMMSVGLLGGPGLGYARDRFSADELKKEDAALYESWKGSGDPSTFYGVAPVQSIDPARLKEAKAAAQAKKAVNAGSTKEDLKKLAETLTPEMEKVVNADIRGNRSTLRLDSLIPAAMAIGYLLLLLYFKAIGGYKPLKIED
jgi:MFS family permease